jgi:Family of unknown function (DUF5343)
MSLPEAYAVGVGGLKDFLTKMRTAGVPGRVTIEFLKTLGLKSSNDRAIIPVLKAIAFLDQSGAPTDAYKQFRDPKKGPKVLAEALRSAYSDLFLANEKAQDLSIEDLKGVIATKTSKGERVVTEIARTFTTLAKAADFSGAVSAPEDDQNDAPADRASDSSARVQAERERLPPPPPPDRHGRAAFHYNIQIHLPTTTDITIYNAIFKSLRENLL